MVVSFSKREKRSRPQVIIDLPVDIPVGTEPSITVLYPKGFELANFKVVAKIVRKEPYWKGNQYWEGYQYGLEFIKILEEDRWKLDLLLSGRYYLEEMRTINDVYPDKETEF